MILATTVAVEAIGSVAVALAAVLAMSGVDIVLALGSGVGFAFPAAFGSRPGGRPPARRGGGNHRGVQPADTEPAE